MLDPDYLEQAGEKVASVYRQIESDMLDYLVSKMIDGDVSGQRAQTAIHLLAQSTASPLMDILSKHDREIDASVKLEVTEALRLSDADDLSRIKRGIGVELPAITNRQIAATVAGAKEILERQNLLMAESARNAFLQQSLWAVTQVNTGSMTTEKALHAAVRRLEGDGISLITYRNTHTGIQTMQNKVDVAVRRHIRTQIAQDGMRLTELRMDEAGVDLVEVSSHGGSRPSHAKWEGRVYSRNGDETIDGVRYRDFKSACNWGDVADGIGGANCRHSFAAWFPGMERSYHPNPDHPSGKTNAEVYDLTQKQRTGERAIRQTKRELRGVEMLYDKTKSAEALGDATRLKIKLRSQQEKMRALIGDNPRVLQRSPRREWAGDMPKVKVPKASGRKANDFLGGEAASRTLKAKGMTKKAATDAIGEAMKERGGSLKDFAALTAGEQQSIFRKVVEKIDGTTKAKAGKHAAPLKIEYADLAGKSYPKIPEVITSTNQVGKVNPHYGEEGFGVNCQRCVFVYEARMRGFDVIAKQAGDEFNDAFRMRWIQSIEGGMTNYKFIPGNPKKAAASIEEAMREFGDGSRAIVSIAWPRSLGGGGHVFIAFNDKGTIRYIDPQSGEIDYVSWKDNMKTGSAAIIRLDNAEFAENVHDALESGVS